MNKAYSYIRFSSPEQAKGRSHARQTEACKKYCALHGLNLAQGTDYTFFDRGLSAYKGEHLGEKGQLTRFLNLVTEGSIEPGSTLIVESLDRLSREDVWTALAVFTSIIEREIRIVTLSDGKVYSKAGGAQDLILSIFQMSRANEESSTKAMRVRDAMANKQAKARESGTPMGKAIPLWLNLSASRKFEAISERADIVKRIFEMAVDGYGRSATARALNSEGISSFKGKNWGTSSINKILNNRAVLGEYQPMSVQVDASNIRQASGPAILGYYPEIISESLFYQAKDAIKGRRVSGSSKQTLNFNVWQGIAKCIKCGTAMHLINKGVGPKGGKYLHCFKARKGLCGARAARLEWSEKYFEQILAKLDSLALVQDSSEKIAKDLSKSVAILEEKRSKVDKFISIFEQTPSGVIADLIRNTENEIKALEANREKLSIALAAEQITDKSQFLAKLDLISYGGRSRANALLKRLEITVSIGPDHYLVRQGKEAIFMIQYHGDDKVFEHVPLVKAQLDKLIRQSDGSKRDSFYELYMIAWFADYHGLDGKELIKEYMPNADEESEKKSLKEFNAAVAARGIFDEP